MSFIQTQDFIELVFLQQIAFITLFFKLRTLNLMKIWVYRQFGESNSQLRKKLQKAPVWGNASWGANLGQARKI